MKKSVILFCLVLILIPSVFAEIQVLNQSIQKTYLGGEKLEGSILVSLEDISADSKVTTSFGESIELLKWLNLSGFKEGTSYNCSTLNCLGDYSKKQTSPIDSVLISEGSVEIVGFNLIGDNVELEELDLDIATNSPQSCVRNLLVDVSNNQTAFLQNRKYVSESCDPIKDGCFNENLGSYQQGILGSSVYCEKISLPIAPAYKVGAKIKNSTQGVGQIKMDLFCEDLRDCGNCILPEHSEDIESLSCIINHTSIFPEEYYVCISSTGGNYKINFETSGELCGTDQIAGNNLDRDYDIFAQAMRFDNIAISVGSEDFIDLNGEGLIGYLNEYILEKYGGDCSNKGCFIPFGFSGIAQSVLFQNPNIKYTWGATTLQNDDLFLLEVDNSLINAGEIELDLGSSGFRVPLSGNNKRLEISIGEDKLIEGLDLSITPSFSFDISPKFTLIGSPTEFRAISNKNITKSSWSFGDGSSDESNNEKIMHTYSQAGDYELEVSLETNQGNARRKFTVLVGDPQLSAQRLLDDYDSRIENLESGLAKFPPFVKTEVEDKVGVGNLKAALVRMRNEFESASDEAGFIDVVENLVGLNIPIGIGYSLEGNYPENIGFENIEVSYIEELVGKNIDDSDLKTNIIDWMGENYGISMDLKIITLFKERENEDVLSFFKVSIENKDNFKGQSYLIIDYPFEGIVFKESYGQKSVNSGAQIALGKKSLFEFVVPGNVQASELGIHVASSEVFDIGNEVIITEDEPFKTFGFLGWLILLTIVFMVVYILLQEWYKRHYENYLFPKKNDLYNLIAFIRNSRNAGLDEGAIKNNLSKSGWNGEHINYGFKKSEGKRTGMWELPLFKFFEKKKVENEMVNRVSANPGRPQMPRPPLGTGSARFIKRPTLR